MFVFPMGFETSDFGPIVSCLLSIPTLVVPLSQFSIMTKKKKNKKTKKTKKK